MEEATLPSAWNHNPSLALAHLPPQAVPFLQLSILLHDAGATILSESGTEFSRLVATFGTDLHHVEITPATAQIPLRQHERLSIRKHRSMELLEPSEPRERLLLGESRRHLNAPRPPRAARRQRLRLIDRAHRERRELTALLDHVARALADRVRKRGLGEFPFRCRAPRHELDIVERLQRQMRAARQRITHAH